MSARPLKSQHWIKFLGTAGARFVMIRQLRASGGLWVNSGSTSVLIDPGPGSLVRCATSRPRLDPTQLNAVILTHRHLDHINDVNVMIEAMTEGGYKQRGVVFLPPDAVSPDAVILPHARAYVGKVEQMNENTSYSVGDFVFQTSQLLRHPCQTFGLKFTLNGTTVALISDTEYFEGLENHFRADVVIVNVVFMEPRPGVQHLSFEDVRRLLATMRPSKAILTHFGLTMLKARPAELARSLGRELDLDIVAATDGMRLEF